MRKDELLALGLSAEQIKAVQVIHGRDMVAFRRKIEGGEERKPLRAAINTMLPLIRDAKSLKQILATVNYLYHAENRIPRNLEAEREEVEEDELL